MENCRSRRAIASGELQVIENEIQDPDPGLHKTRQRLPMTACSSKPLKIPWAQVALLHPLPHNPSPRLLRIDRWRSASCRHQKHRSLLHKYGKYIYLIEGLQGSFCFALVHGHIQYILHYVIHFFRL
jgi:hypothetical protein